ncbi:MAG: SMP-30/gluconolactonase/LRE family protein, partial [Gemmataceae bacterium]
MRRLLLLASALAVGLLCAPAAEDKTKTLGTIERLDPALDDLLAKDAVLEVLGGGYNWIEGPVWDKKAGHLLFSDIPSNSVYRYKPGEAITLFL